MKRMLSSVILLIIFSVLLTSCSVLNVYSGKGTIQYFGFEGGFYGLVADDGEHYLVTNLDTEYPEFMVDSLRVRYRVKGLEDVGSFVQWGIIVEALSLKKLE
ncbi:hypothetical protein JXM67_14675 [candidate division WOR-3 bacterium]|nr:hypothetical protein [candidate division WOR-3 bacterium]